MRTRFWTTLLAASMALSALTTMAGATTAHAEVLADTVNASGMSPTSATPTATLGINRTNERKAFDFFVSQGLSKKQAAGIIGNLDQESGMDPRITQIGGGPGRGIAQWGVGGRWDTYAGDNVVDYSATLGVSRYSLTGQLTFTWYELTSFSYYGLSALRATTTVKAATQVFQDRFEGCGTCNFDARLAYAKDAYARYT
ncbi:MAG: phage tail tip lysozyme [Lapillicoccus sp.]